MPRGQASSGKWQGVLVRAGFPANPRPAGTSASTQAVMTHLASAPKAAGGSGLACRDAWIGGQFKWILTEALSL